MDALTRDDLRELIVERPGPCISFLMPTTRGPAHEDKARFKKMLRDCRNNLNETERPNRTEELLAPAQRLLDDDSFWQNVSAGLAAYLAPDFARIVRLPTPVAEQQIVAEHFHIKPLVPIVQDDGRFYILALAQKQVHLYSATRWTVAEVDVPGMPANKAEALRYDDLEIARTVHTHTAPGGPSGSREAIAHGHGVGVDSNKDGLREFCQEVNRALERWLHAHQKAPLVPAGAEFLVSIFRHVCSYRRLVKETIGGNPELLSDKELRDRAWPVVQPVFDELREKTAALFAQSAGTGRTVQELPDVLRAAHEGRLQFLFVAGDRTHWGRFNPVDGQIAEHTAHQPRDDDLLNVAAILALNRGATVFVVEAARIPGGGFAAGLAWLPAGERSGKRVIS